MLKTSPVCISFNKFWVLENGWEARGREELVGCYSEERGSWAQT